MKKICIFIDHDIIIRHFLYSGVLSELDKTFDVTYVLPKDHRRVKADWKALGLSNARMIAVSEDRAYLFRRLNHSTVLSRLRRTPDKQMAYTFWKDNLGATAFYKAWVLSWPGILPLYRNWILKRVGESAALEQLLAEEKPDLILHPTVLEGLFVSDLIRWGRKREVPVVFIMNSWDNPAAKAMLVGNPDQLLVWGEQSKVLAQSYLQVTAKNITIMGAAQFDLYTRPPQESPAAYRQRVGLPLEQKVLLYAGSSKGLNETRHLERLDAAIESGELQDCAILYRPHPWRSYPKEEKDFFDVTFKHVVMDPTMEACYRMGRTGSRMFVELADYKNTHITLSAVDAVISPLSTILLEAALHGKPIAAYLPDEDMRQNKWLFSTSNMVHFRDFFARVDCLKCQSSEQLVQDCAALLAKTREPHVAEKLREQCSYFVSTPSKPYATRLAEFLQQLLATTTGLRPVDRTRKDTPELSGAGR